MGNFFWRLRRQNSDANLTEKIPIGIFFAGAFGAKSLASGGKKSEMRQAAGGGGLL